LLGASNALAAAPPANTLIGNQASAAYKDSNGASQLATSNLVQTLVQQVGAFTLTSDNTKSAAGGNTVYAPHTLTNTGNGPDAFTVVITDDTTAANFNFTKIEVFLDANGDGLPDNTTPLCSVIPPAPCSVPAQNVAGNGGTFKFVVAYTVPTGLAAGAVNTAAVVGSPPSGSTLGYSPTSVTNTDTVNVTNLAAFSATKALVTPAVLAPGNKQWPTAFTTGPRSSGACPVTFATITPSASCDYSVYTINYKNTGGATGVFFMQDTLPAGFTYVNGSTVWSGNGGVALTETTGSNGANVDFAVSGQSLSARVASVGPNVAGTFSFVVLINPTATIGIGSTNNTASYDRVTSTNSTAIPTTPGTSSTNPAPFTVTATYGVVLGSATGTAVGSLDTTTGTPNGTAFDLNTVPSITSGGSIQFTQKLFNTGNAPDTFNLNISSSTFPAGTTFSFYAADGRTPLLDTNSDGIVDSGSIAAGATVNIVVIATIPASTPASATGFTMVVRAASVGGGTFDASQDTVSAVTGILVDLTNTAAGTGSGMVLNGDLGQGPSPQPTTTATTAAGTGAIFTLFIKNNDVAASTYNLVASQTTSFPGSLPAGWTVKFVTAGTGCLATGSATTVSIAAGSQLQIDACVTPPASAPVGAITNIYFRVTSTSNPLAVDTKTDAVNVNSVALTYSATLTPNNQGQVIPGGTVVYAHTLTNTGAQACGAYTLAATQTGSTAGWTNALFIDVNGNGVIDAGDTPVTAAFPGPLAAGTSQKILVRVFAPGGATPGLTDTVTLTATFAAPTPNCGTLMATDITTIVTGSNPCREDSGTGCRVQCYRPHLQRGIAAEQTRQLRGLPCRGHQ